MTNQSTLSQLVLSDPSLILVSGELSINKCKYQGILYKMGHKFSKSFKTPCLGVHRKLLFSRTPDPWAHGKHADPDPEVCDPGSGAVIPDPTLF